MKYLLILIIIMITSTCLFSEVIVLNNGKIIRGEIIYQNEIETSIKTKTEVINIANTDIKKIILSDYYFNDNDESLQTKKLSIKYLFGSFFLSGFSNFTLAFNLIPYPDPNIVRWDISMIISAVSIGLSTFVLGGIPYFSPAFLGSSYLIAGITLLVISPSFFLSISIPMLIMSAFQIFTFIIQTLAYNLAYKNIKKKLDKISLILYPELSLNNINNSTLSAGLSIKF